MPIIGDVQGDVAELSNGAQHFESGKVDGLGRIVPRLLGGNVDDDRALLFFFQFDEYDLAGIVGRFCLPRSLRFLGNSIFRVLASGRGGVGDQFRTARQPNAELIESAAEAANGQAGVAANAATIDGDVNGADSVENGGNGSCFGVGGLPGQAELTGQAGDIDASAIWFRLFRCHRAAVGASLGDWRIYC